MRGHDAIQSSWFSYVSLEERIPKQHPLRRLRLLVDGVLTSMDAVFAERYSHTGRPSIAPEKLLRALLLQVLYTVRSERQLMEQLDYNLLFRWFVGLGIDDAVWERTVFSANRERLLSEALSREFFERVLAIAEWQNLVSDEHFSVDGSLIEAWASHKSFVKKDGSGPDKPAGRNPEVDFSGEKRSNATHQSTTDPEARLYKKGEYTEAKLRYITHALSENRNGLIVDVETTQATGTAEIEAAQTMIKRRVPKGGSVGADKGYDQPAFVNGLNTQDIKAHVARKKTGSAVDGRTARGKGYAQSLKRRKIVEEAFGWIKTVGGLRKTRHIGLAKVAGQALFCFAAYNLTRLLNLLVFTPKPAWSAPT
ncbi:IS5 family transposase [Methylomonas koyamae]|uniref:IS5 family transposase n=1 Tax=Methylomonas koyamae TaxID=702114 RepID=UPI000BC2E0BE|nr:IS5 family transposase [Methylomonas koyamae]ATG88430.1 transposase [Methylomonas koyamae]ATG91048.1 transposase [Methylomonas koyamae]